MTTQLNNTQDKNSSFQLKGGLYPLTSLQLSSTDLLQLTQFLDTKIKQAPQFFQNAPIVIDLQKLAPESQEINFNQLIGILKERKLFPLGIRGGSSTQQAAAIASGLVVLPEGSKEIENKSGINTLKNANNGNMANAASNAASNPSSNVFSNVSSDATSIAGTQSTTLSAMSAIQGSNTKVITDPVRSGQQIYARGGDLIVLSSVSHGAELLADGHIHIYGPLRGRALAGVTGDTSAHIFCQSLEAELISIAGQYKISEDIGQTFWRIAADIFLSEGRLHISPL